MQLHGENGMAVARYLEQSDRVEEVLCPGLESDPQHNLLLKISRGMSGMVSFRIKGDLESAKTFLASLKVFTLAESLGGFESLAEHPAIMTHASVPPAQREVLGITDTFIRLSVGLENEADLISDLEQALKTALPGSY